jgi:uncharacterized membrane protein YfcA
LNFDAWIPPVHGGAWAVLATAAICIGLAKGGLGGFGFVPVLILASIFPPRLSTGVLLVQLISADLMAVRIFHQHANWAQIRRIFPAALCGVVIGWMLMGIISDRTFRPLLGVIILILAVLQLLRRYLGDWIERTRHSHAFVWSMGGLGGVTTMMANAAGPVMSLYFLALRLPKMELVGTSAWFFLILNVCKTPFSAKLGLMPAWAVTLCVLMCPLIFAGVLSGKWVVKRLPQRVFELLVVIFAIVGGLRLLFA